MIVTSLLCGLGAFILFLEFGEATGLTWIDVFRAVLILISTLWLAWGVVAGGVLQILIQLPLLRQLGLIPRPAAPWGAPGVRRALALMGPAAFGVAVLQINILIDRWLASFLAEGSISYLYYANRLVQFPHGLLCRDRGLPYKEADNQDENRQDRRADIER